MPQLTLLRHGESVWNRADRFAGWADVALTGHGVAEARRAGRLLRARGQLFEHGFTSVLCRAIRTLWIVLEEIEQTWLPVEKSWRLNERHYGDLEGRRRSETVRRYGVEQTELWRWSYAATPPPLAPDDPRSPVRDRRYAHLRADELPRSESLKDALDRVLPLWEGQIAPRLRHGGSLLVVAHGSSLRALIKHIEGIPDGEVAGLRVPTGEPILYGLDASLHPVEKEQLRSTSGSRAGRWLKRQWARKVWRA